MISELISVISQPISLTYQLIYVAYEPISAIFALTSMVDDLIPEAISFRLWSNLIWMD